MKKFLTLVFVVLILFSNSSKADILHCFKDGKIYKYPVFFMGGSMKSEILKNVGRKPSCKKIDQVIENIENKKKKKIGGANA